MRLRDYLKCKVGLEEVDEELLDLYAYYGVLRFVMYNGGEVSDFLDIKIDDLEKGILPMFEFYTLELLRYEDVFGVMDKEKFEIIIKICKTSRKSCLSRGGLDKVLLQQECVEQLPYPSFMVYELYKMLVSRNIILS